MMNPFFMVEDVADRKDTMSLAIFSHNPADMR